MGVAFRELPVGRSRWPLPQSRDRGWQGSTHCGYCVHGSHLLPMDHDRQDLSTPATLCAAGALMRTPDGQGQIELDKLHTPGAIRIGPENVPVNALGIRRIMFAVDDIDDVVARLRAHGAELVGELVQYEDTYRVCYVRGPEGIIVGLAEQL